jgi:hypothetical protein
MNPATIEAIASILDYMQDEETHLKECDESERAQHIYHHVTQLRSWLDNECPAQEAIAAKKAIAADWANVGTGTDPVEIKLVRTNFLTRWPCTVCGGCTEKVVVLAEGSDHDDAFHDSTVRVCETCLEHGNIDQRLEDHAARLVDYAAAIRALKGRLQVPTYAEWCDEVEKSDRDAAEAMGYDMARYDAERAAYKRGRADKAAGKTLHDIPPEYRQKARRHEAEAWLKSVKGWAECATKYT